MSQLIDYRCFLKVAETHSFSKASRELGLNQSTITRSIKNLEYHLSVPLFYRTTRSVSLTPHGKNLLFYVQKIIHDLDSVETKFKNETQSPTGKLKVGLPMAVATTFIVPRLREFLKKYPDLKLELLFEDRFVDIVGEAYDLVVRVGELKDSTLKARKLSTVKRALVAHPSLLKSKNTKIIDPSGLMSLPWVIFDHQWVNDAYFRFKKNNSSKEVCVKPTVVINHLESAYKLIKQGCGIGVLPKWFIQDDLNKGALVELLDDWVVSGQSQNESSIYAIYPNTNFESKKVRVFIDFLVEQFSKT